MAPEKERCMVHCIFHRPTPGRLLLFAQRGVWIAPIHPAGQMIRSGLLESIELTRRGQRQQAPPPSPVHCPRCHRPHKLPNWSQGKAVSVSLGYGLAVGDLAGGCCTVARPRQPATPCPIQEVLPCLHLLSMSIYNLLRKNCLSI